jgi:hypothetical protein
MFCSIDLSVLDYIIIYFQRWSLGGFFKSLIPKGKNEMILPDDKKKTVSYTKWWYTFSKFQSTRWNIQQHLVDVVRSPATFATTFARAVELNSKKLCILFSEKLQFLFKHGIFLFCRFIGMEINGLIQRKAKRYDLGMGTWVSCGSSYIFHILTHRNTVSTI